MLLLINFTDEKYFNQLIDEFIHKFNQSIIIYKIIYHQIIY